GGRVDARGRARPRGPRHAGAGGADLRGPAHRAVSGKPRISALPPRGRAAGQLRESPYSDVWPCRHGRASQRTNHAGPSTKSHPGARPALGDRAMYRRLWLLVAIAAAYFVAGKVGLQL